MPLKLRNYYSDLNDEIERQQLDLLEACRIVMGGLGLDAQTVFLIFDENDLHKFQKQALEVLRSHNRNRHYDLAKSASKGAEYIIRIANGGPKSQLSRPAQEMLHFVVQEIGEEGIELSISDKYLLQEMQKSQHALNRARRELVGRQFLFYEKTPISGTYKYKFETRHWGF